MIRNMVRSVCPHRFLILKGIDQRQSVEGSRCDECGTPLIRPAVLLRDPVKDITSDSVTSFQRRSARKLEIVFGSIFPLPA